MKQRESARLERERKLTEKRNGCVLEGEEEADKYELYVKCFEECAEDDLPPIPPPRRTLKRLVDIALEKLAEHFDAVEDLGDDVIPEHRARLGHLLSQRRRLTEEAVQILTMQGSSSFILAECSMISQDILIDAIKKSSEDIDGEITLRILKLDNCGFGFTDKTVDATLSCLSKLEILTVTGCYRLSDSAMVKILGTAKNIQHLDVINNSRLTENFVETVAQECKALRTLRLDNSLQIYGSHLRHLTQMKSLQYVSFANLKEVTDSNIISLLESIGGGLKGINLSGCHQLTDSSIVAIRSSCSDLKELDLSCLPHLTKLGMMGLFVESEEGDRSIGCLDTLKLKDLSCIDDDVMIQAAQLCKHFLRHLDLNGCSNVGNKSIAALKIHCSASLETLDLSFVRNIWENITVALVCACVNLRDLQIWGCSQLTVRAFSFFSGNIN